MTLASQHMRFFTSHDIPHVSTAEFVGLAPARQVPCGCNAPDVVTKRLTWPFRTDTGSSPLGKDEYAPNFLYTVPTCRMPAYRSFQVLSSSTPSSVPIG